MARQWWLRNSPRLLPCRRPALYLVPLAPNTITTSEISAALVFRIAAPMSPSQTDLPTTPPHRTPKSHPACSALPPALGCEGVHSDTISEASFLSTNLIPEHPPPPLEISKPLKREHRPNHTTNKAFFILFDRTEEKHISQVTCLEGSGCKP